MTREPIYSALFALVSGASGVRTASRRIKSFADVSSGDQPALFMEQKSEQQDVTTKMPGKWTLNVDLVVYVNTGGNDQNVIPSTVLNPILDGICSKLVPPPQFGEQTLGGLVARCRIQGAIEIVEGVQGDQAFALIPVVLFTPD
jgi:hypothetical protein